MDEYLTNNDSIIMKNENTKTEESYDNLQFFLTTANYCSAIHTQVEDISGQIHNLKTWFKVKNGEKIIGYMSSQVGFLGTSKEIMVIFTDKAIYSLDILPNSGSNRCEYDSICKYVYYNGGDIELIGPEGVLILAKSSVLGTFLNAGDQLGKIIRDLQDYNLKRRNRARQDRAELCLWLEQSARKEIIENGCISSGTLSAMVILAREKEYTKRLYYYIFADAIVNFDRQKFVAAMNNMNKWNDVVQTAVKRYIKVLCNRSIENLSKFDRDYEKKFIEDSYEIACKHESLTNTIDCNRDIVDFFEDYMDKSEQLLEAHFDDCEFWTYTNVILQYVEEANLQESLILNKLICNDFNMEKIAKGIKRDIFSCDNLDIEDSMGFNVLHYAIIFRQEELAKTLIKKYDELPFCLDMEFDDPDMVRIYDYSFVASYLGMEDLADELILYSPELIGLTKMAEAIYKRIQFRKKFSFATEISEVIGKASIRDMERAMDEGEYVDYDTYEKKLNYQDIRLAGIERLRYEIEDLEQQEEELYDEIENAKIAYKEKMKIYIENIKKSDELIIQWILYIYENPNYLLDILREEERSLMCYKDFFFAIPNSIEDKFEYWKGWKEKYSFIKWFRRDKTQEEEKIPFDRIFSDSWFSEEAHRNFAKLGKEYKMLAKQYHPDNNPEAKFIFVDIQKERAEIIESLTEEEDGE